MKKIQIILVTIFLSLLTTAIASMAYANPTLSVFDCGLLAFDDVSDFGITNNGISIIPTFSLKQPAFNLSYSLSRGGRFSIDPDLRLTFDGGIRTLNGSNEYYGEEIDKLFHFTYPDYEFVKFSVDEMDVRPEKTNYEKFIELFSEK